MNDEDDNDTDDGDKWEDYETGPFCQHWSDPIDCDIICACGHACCNHSRYDSPRECNEDGCDCVKFTDAK